MEKQLFPSRVVLELTPHCNLSCAMCPRHSIKEEGGYMSEQVFKKLVDEILVENEQAIVLPFWRGESCLHPNFLNLLRYALDKGMRVHISTNGHFMDQEFMDVFYRCEFVTFSLHTHVGYANAKKMITQKPSWSRATTQVSCVDSEKNANKFLAECVSDPALMGFDSIRLYIEHTVDGVFGKNIKQVDASRVFCPKLKHTFVVSADGRYSRCNHIWEPEEAPNLNHASIKKIWNGPRMKEIRTGYPDNRCASCDQWSGHTRGEAWQKGVNGRINHIVYGVARENEASSS